MGWTRNDLAKKSGLSLATIKRYEGSSIDELQHGYHDNLDILANTLEIDSESLVFKTNDDAETNGPVYRDCSGKWRVTGTDIHVAEHFEYPNDPKGFVAEMTLEVHGSKFGSKGIDDDGDEQVFSGTLHENGNFLIGAYRVKNNRMNAYGSAVLQYLGCGTRMEGFYLGRDVGQGGTFILGRLSVERIK